MHRRVLAGAKCASNLVSVISKSDVARAGRLMEAGTVIRWLLVGLLAACTKAESPASPDASSESDAAVQVADAAIDASPREITLNVPNHPLDAAPNDFVVAFQDGDGPWTRAPAPVGDDYTIPIENERYGVLVACSGLWQRQGAGIEHETPSGWLGDDGLHRMAGQERH